MEFDVIACCRPEIAPALCQSLLPRAGQLHLSLVSSAKPLDFPKKDAFSGFAVLPQAPGQSKASWLNTAVQSGGSPHLLFLFDVFSLESGFWEALENAIAQHGESTCFECRSLPNEPQHHVDPAGLQSPALGSAALYLPRTVFRQAGVLDACFPEANLWDEFSMRIRGLGVGIFYLPTATVHAEAPPEDTFTAYTGGEYNKLLLAAKYGTHSQRKAAHKAWRAAFRTPQPFPHVRRLLLEQYLRGFGTFLRLKKWQRKNAALAQNIKRLAPNGAGLARGVCPLAPVERGPKISVVVRTHNRPAQLRGALQSVANQTYKNYEVVVIEDGAPTAEAMLREEFPHLPLLYHATGQPVGRSRAGNIGLEKATGDYCNFLDDDDYFYPDHLEQMAAQMAAHPEADLILGCSVSLFTDDNSALAETRERARYERIRFDRLDVFTMSQMCQIPLLSAAFKRELFLQYGGLHEGIDAHEDWAMWLKYLAKGRRIHPHGIDIPRATSVFLQPASQAQAQQRLAAYKVFDETLFHDAGIRFDVSLADMRHFYDGMLADIRHVNQLGRLDEFLQRESNRNTP